MGTPVRRWLAQGDNLLFAGLLLLSLLPLWSACYFPSQDGPAHLENAVILREYNWPDRELFRTFYLINPNPEPNWVGHLALAGLMALGLPPLLAEKVLLTGYLLLLPLAVRYAMTALRADAG